MFKPVKFTVVEMAGTPYEMGLAYGKQCKGLIKRLGRKFDDILMPPEY